MFFLPCKECCNTFKLVPIFENNYKEPIAIVQISKIFLEITTRIIVDGIHHDLT